MGAKVEATINRMTDRTKPAKGQPWDSFERRAADALGGMCDAVEVAERIETADVGGEAVVGGRGPACTVRRRSRGSRCADAVVEQLRATAGIEPVLVDDDGVPVAIGETHGGAVTEGDPGDLVAGRSLPVRVLRHPVRVADPSHPAPVVGWDRRSVEPRCGVRPRGSSPEVDPARTVGAGRQPQPTRRARLVHLDDLTEEEAEQLGLPPPSARPD